MTSIDRKDVGLCATCRHARIVPTTRAEYWLCRLSASDPSFDRYPRLPVLACRGYERGESPLEAEEGGG